MMKDQLLIHCAPSGFDIPYFSWSSASLTKFIARIQQRKRLLNRKCISLCHTASIVFIILHRLLAQFSVKQVITYFYQMKKSFGSAHCVCYLHRTISIQSRIHFSDVRYITAGGLFSASVEIAFGGFSAAGCLPIALMAFDTSAKRRLVVTLAVAWARVPITTALFVTPIFSDPDSFFWGEYILCLHLRPSPPRFYYQASVKHQIFHPLLTLTEYVVTSPECHSRCEWEAE